MTRLFNSRRRCGPSLGSQARLGQDRTGDLQKQCCTNSSGAAVAAPLIKSSTSEAATIACSRQPSGRLGASAIKKNQCDPSAAVAALVNRYLRKGIFRWQKESMVTVPKCVCRLCRPDGHQPILATEGTRQDFGTARHRRQKKARKNGRNALLATGQSRAQTHTNLFVDRFAAD